MDIYQACAKAGPSRCPIYERTASLVKARVDKLLDRLKSEPVAFYNSTSTESAYDVVDYGLVKTAIFRTLYVTHNFGANLTSAIAALERGDASQFYAVADRRILDQLLQCNCPVPGEPSPPFDRGFDITAAIACGDAVEDRGEDLREVREAYEEMARMSSFADNWPMRAWCS